MAPGEICILIYLSYILYISKFFIPLQWLHASFMGSSAVFGGPIQAHFTCHTAAASLPISPWVCRLDEKFIVRCHLIFFFSFTLLVSRVTMHLIGWSLLLLICGELSKLHKKHLSLTWKWLFCCGWVTDIIRWIWKWCVDATQKARQIYLWSTFNRKFIRGEIFKKVKAPFEKNQTNVKISCEP